MFLILVGDVHARDVARPAFLSGPFNESAICSSRGGQYFLRAPLDFRVFFFSVAAAAKTAARFDLGIL